MNEEEKEAIKEVKEIIDDYEYPSILNEIKKTNYGNKDLIQLWNAIDDESSNYLEYSDFDIAKAIVYLVNLVDKQQKEIEELKEKNKKIEIIVNKLMPLAECSYWNYENHTCSHTCRGCDDLNDINKRTSSGIIIDKDRYCRLYEDGYAEEDTKFVSVEDLIKRHY